jgi:hypothetical protein
MMRRSSARAGRAAHPASLVPAIAAGQHGRLQSLWQHWGNFIEEIIIVVLGVLIALGADNIVSTIRDRSASAEARATIRDELGENLGRMEQRDATRDCIDARLNELAAYLDRAETGAAMPTLHWIGRPQVWPMLDSRWSATASAGKASLLSSREQGNYGAIYANVRDFQNNQATEQLAWAQLRQIAEHPRLGPQQIAALRDALQNARYAAWLSHVIVWQVTQDAAQLGITGRTSMKGSRSICIATSTPFDDAVRQAGATLFGEPR